jgi:protein-disulfide isomerase
MRAGLIRAAVAMTVPVLAVLCLSLAGGAADAQTPPATTDQAIANHADDLLHDPASPAIGAPGADVTIVEFFDYTCPYCKATEPRLEALLKADKGVRLVLKEFPILTPQSLIASKAGLAAARQGKYARFHQALMSYRGPLTAPVIFDTAKGAGVDLARLRRDMASPQVSDEIIADFNLARALRIFAAPAFIIDGRLMTGPSADIDFPKAVAAARGK